VVGLFGGYLTDRVGRRRVLVWSIVLYGVAAAGTALATSLPALLVWRCLTIAGACVEFVAAIAWLAEIFPEPRQREAVLGYTQAFSALGAFLVAGSYYVSITFGGRFPAIHGAHDAWRYTLLCGMLPAIPLMLVRPFLPESPVWRRRRATGTLSRPRLSSLFALTCADAGRDAGRVQLGIAVMQRRCRGRLITPPSRLPQHDRRPDVGRALLSLERPDPARLDGDAYRVLRLGGQILGRARVA
jgi:MFS family permease